MIRIVPQQSAVWFTSTQSSALAQVLSTLANTESAPVHWKALVAPVPATPALAPLELPALDDPPLVVVPPLADPPFVFPEVPPAPPSSSEPPAE
jgi:hypothetical protein